MENDTFSVSHAKNPIIAINVISGHFTTSNLHTNNYLDFSALKSNSVVARDIAREMAISYLSTTLVDTIVCMERTEVIGAYLAQELQLEGPSVINTGKAIHVVSPINNAYGNLTFPSNQTEIITGKNILLLVATVSSGRSLNRILECLSYYNGNLAGISALFMATPVRTPHKVNALFTSDDIPGYKLYEPGECEICKNTKKLDAIIRSEGYTKIE